MEYEITMAFSDMRNNSVLARIASECLMQAGAPLWEESDYALAKGYLDSYDERTRAAILSDLKHKYGEDALPGILERPLHSGVYPYDPDPDHMIREGGSTDVGDVTYTVPTCELRVASACMGNVGHTWQNTAFSCSEIGFKGMIKAAEVMALSACRTMEQPELIEKAKAELKKKNGGKYICPLPDYIQPPIETYY